MENKEQHPESILMHATAETYHASNTIDDCFVVDRTTTEQTQHTTQQRQQTRNEI